MANAPKPPDVSKRKALSEDRKLEADLKSNFKQYSAQLADVEATIAANDPTSPDLPRLQDAVRVLKEAIAMTEESLLNLKKAQLLEQYNEANDDDESDKEPEKRPFPEGHPVQALWTTKDGTMWMDATILPGGSSKSVLVSYDTPIEQTMKTCRFLNSTKSQCRYGDQCKFSHGFLLPVSSVRKRVLGKLTQGGPCLAKYQVDGLWYNSSVEKYIDEKTILVYYNGYDTTAEVDMDDIVPLPAIAHTHDKKKGELRLSHIEIPISQVDRDFGDWEQHTKGFGLKMLEKFGYKVGEGLGKEGKGIAEPVLKDPVNLPRITSVDHATDDLEHMKKVKDREEARVKRKLEAVAPEPAVVTITKTEKTVPLTPVEARKRLRQVTDEVAQTKNEVQSHTQGIARNKSNAQLVSVYQRKLQQAQAKLGKLQQEALALQRGTTKKTSFEF